MGLIKQHIDMLLILLGSFLGAIKASVEVDHNRTIIARTIDIMLGMFIGVFVAQHLGTQYNIWLSGLMAMIGGASGALVIEVFLQMLPKITRNAIKSFIKK